MIKNISIVLICILVGCSPSAEERAAKQKIKQDSIAATSANEAKENARLDSINNAGYENEGDSNAEENNIVEKVVVIFDIDSNSYQTVEIGNQIWMSENLNVSHYRNGDEIPEAKTNDEWIDFGRGKKGCWSYYNYDPQNEKVFGKIYNRYVTLDPRGVAPEGWHIPFGRDWKVLLTLLNFDVAGKKMKCSSGWQNYTEAYNGTNISGFSAVPSGKCDNFGNFSGAKEYCCYWSLWAKNEDNQWGKAINGIDQVTDAYPVEKPSGSVETYEGMSIRCVKDILTQNAALGASYEGGTVFYIDETLKHGLIVSEPLSNSGTDWNNAKSFSEAYSGGGFHNWRLPTFRESQILNEKNSGFRCEDAGLWTSSNDEDNSNKAYAIFHNGDRLATVEKSKKIMFRAVRSF